MPVICVTLTLLDKRQVEDFKIRLDVTGEDLIDFVIAEMGLRRVDQNNETIDYYLERLDDGKRLDLKCPLVDLGVKDGDTIALRADGLVIDDEEEDEDDSETVNLVDPPEDKNGEVTVNLSVLDVHKIDLVTFDTSKTVEETLEQVILKYNLPRSNPKRDEAYNYTISSNALSRYLLPGETLASEEVPSGDTLTVHRPAIAGAIDPPDARTGRLQKELSELITLSKRGSRKGGLLKIDPVNYKQGCPVEEYIVTFTCKGIVGIKENLKPIYDDFHQVKLILGSGFPVDPPYTRWLTRIWHPNIEHLEPHHACVTEDWWVGCKVADLVITMGEMVQYRKYHAAWKPPWPLDLEVAKWVENYAEPNGIVGKDKPVDSRPLLPDQRIGPHPEKPDEKMSFDWNKVSPLPAKLG